MDKSAILSPCENYRYSLSRIWDRHRKPMVIIGLNPSTADETEDDPTIRRCIGFAKRENAGGLIMMNLFALRSTDPRELLRHRSPVGHENDKYLSEMIRDRINLAYPAIAAWGTHGRIMGRDRKVKALFTNHARGLQCFGDLTKNGFPRHPLYLRGDTPINTYLPN